MKNSREAYIDYFRSYINKYGLSVGCRGAVGGDSTFEIIGKKTVVILKAHGLEPHHTLLDVGCGPGRIANALGNYLADSGKYLGLDIMEEPLALARKTADPSYRFALLYDDLPRSWADFVLFNSVMTHLHDYESYKYLLQAKRALKPKGKILVSYMHWEDEGHWKLFMESVNGGPLLMKLLNESIWKTWAKHLQMEISFTGLTPIGQYFAILRLDANT